MFQLVYDAQAYEQWQNVPTPFFPPHDHTFSGVIMSSISIGVLNFTMIVAGVFDLRKCDSDFTRINLRPFSDEK